MPNAHGSPARVYLNQKVTPHLLEGVKYLAVHEPEKPLQWLADFLRKKSEELEGT
jgi:COMPASS component SDC1